MQRASSRPVWNGSINFGLVTIPVKLYTAVREKRLSFRSLHDQDKVPLKQKLVCPADGKEVHPEHIVKGFEIEKDQYVVIQQEELDAVKPKATKSIEIQDFVDLADIDPVYFDKPYYVAPKPEGIKPYQLLVQAMQSKKKVGIARIVMHTKEYLAALRPLDDVLCLETMHFSDEVVPASQVEGAGGKSKVNERELKIAQQLIDSLASKFNPAQYHDEYREQVMEMIEKKAKGQKTVIRPEAKQKTSRAGDLLASLEASLAASRPSRNGSARRPAGRRRRQTA